MTRLILACVVFSLCGSAWAQDHKIDFSQLVLDDNDQPVTECERAVPPKVGLPPVCVEEINLTLGMYAAKALNARFQEEANLPFDEQVHRGQIAYWIKRAHEVSLTTDSKCPPNSTDCLTVVERDLILRNIGKMGWPTLIVWRLKTALDGR